MLYFSGCWNINGWSSKYISSMSDFLLLIWIDNHEKLHFWGSNGWIWQFGSSSAPTSRHQWHQCNETLFVLIGSEIDARADFVKKKFPIITTSIIAVVTHIRGTLHGGHLKGGGYSYKSKSKSKGNNKESCIPNGQLRQLQPVCIINVEIQIQSENMISRFSLVLTCRNLTLAITLTPFFHLFAGYFICRIFHLHDFLFARFFYLQDFSFAGFFYLQDFSFAGFFICRIFYLQDFSFPGFFLCRIFLFAGFFIYRIFHLQDFCDNYIRFMILDSALCITKTTQYLNHPLHMIN